MAHGNEINSKRFYWLKMDRHFFNDARIKKMRKLPKGDTCVIIYQKLLLLSVEYGGVLVYEHIEDSFEKEMALKLEEKETTTETTIQYLKQQGMLVSIEGKDDEFFLIQAQNSIGSETKSNVYKRQKRDGKEWLEKFQPNSNQIPIEKDIDIDINTDIEVSKKEEEINNYQTSAGVRVRARKSYEQIMNDCMLSEVVRPTLWEFIKHCQLNGKTLTNDKLSEILVDMDMRGYDDQAKITALNEAIRGGYFDIKRGA